MPTASPVNGAVLAEGRTALRLLTGEASRQLTVCNACRYCEGFCAVFPALSRRNVVDSGAVTQLSNLCHDCRACFDACMYTEPHEFAINIPKVLSEVRVSDYRRLVWPARVPAAFSGWTGTLLGGLIPAVLLVVIAVINVGWRGITAYQDRPQSPYALVPYPVLVALMSAACLFSVVVMGVAARRYWREVGGTPGKFRAQAVLRAAWYAATLRYLRGGGQECTYPEDDKPSPVRRNLHALVAYGFGLCLVSTIAAAVLQDALGSEPPYPFFSVPVIAGTLGGIGLVTGCLALLVLKTRASAVTSFAAMTVKDYGLLVSLAFLGLSGLAVLLTRDTAAFGIVLLIHLAAVTEAFAMAPYSKFVHVVFRGTALVRDNLERDEALRVRAGG